MPGSTTPPPTIAHASSTLCRRPRQAQPAPVGPLQPLQIEASTACFLHTSSLPSPSEPPPHPPGARRAAHRRNLAGARAARGEGIRRLEPPQEKLPVPGEPPLSTLSFAPSPTLA